MMRYFQVAHNLQTVIMHESGEPLIISLRKHVYSNILKILQPKQGKFSDKNSTKAGLGHFLFLTSNFLFLTSNF